MRAELFSSDFMISMFIFLSALLIIVFYYQNLQTDVYETSNRNDMYSKAINLASLLAESSGYPQFWNSTNVEIIGLYDSGKFNLTKFGELKNIDYQTAKVLLGTGVYNFNITLKNTTGSIIEKPSNPNYKYTYGLDAANAEQTMLVKRLGVADLEGNATKIIMEVILWL